jgi:hypothetical protein
MIRFDWRRYEPLELRRDGWPEPISADLLNRYSGFLREPSPWRDLVMALFERPATQPFWIEWLDAFPHRRHPRRDPAARSARLLFAKALRFHLPLSISAESGP